MKTFAFIWDYNDNRTQSYLTYCFKSPMFIRFAIYLLHIITPYKSGGVIALLECAQF